MTPKEKRNEKLAEKLIANLERRHFEAYYCHTASDIIDKVKEIIPEGSSISWGGSMSIRDTGLTQALKAGKYNIFDRDDVTGEDAKRAIYLKAFGAKVLYTDLYRLSDELEQELSLTYVPSFEDLLPHVDILSFHCPLTPENKEMLNADAISKMNAGTIVVNTARGKLIDEQALYEALKSGKLRMAALDVHYEEPIRQDCLLKTLDNVILTPHIGGLSYEAFYKMMHDAMENIVIFEQGKVENIVRNKLDNSIC